MKSKTVSVQQDGIFSPRIHTKGEHVLAFQKHTFKYLGTVYTMWKMKKHQKKVPQNDQPKEILASIKGLPFQKTSSVLSETLQMFQYKNSSFL